MATEAMTHGTMHHASADLTRYLVPLGRLFFTLIFLQSVLFHFTPAAMDYAASQGVPAPNVLVPLSGVMAFLGGLSVLLGYHARAGAIVLILFLIPVTGFMHAFWNIADPMMRQVQMVMFMKNVSILGAAIMIAHMGAGPLSLDARHEPRREA
jgi:putative oxidoreductase